MNRHLASRFTVGLALATLVGTSAFAEDRPSNETRRGRDTVRRERAADRSDVRRGDNSSNRRRDERQYDRDRSHGNRSYGHRSYDRQPYYAHGRVSRISPYHGGYRVWIGGAPYPFFVPSAYYNRNRFRVGLDIRLGGYYNPLGYYDYDDGYYDNRGYSSAELRGVVESVDYRRDTFVVRNDATGSFVTVEMRDRRRDVRAGDYVELEGEWTRSGLFRAYDLNRIDDGYRR